MMEEDNSSLEAELTEIPAGKILDEIRNGEPVEYNHVVIKDDIDIDCLDLQKNNSLYVIDSPIKIENSQINGLVEFSEAQFKKSIKFTGTKFNAGASFNYAQFDEKADFVQTYFDKGMFRAAHFKMKANFAETHFRRGNWTYSQFDRAANFFGAQFEGYISFYGSNFDDKANFLEAKINVLDSPEIFKATKFKRPKDEEIVCRKAKKMLEEQGNKDEADTYFYREMAARRIQKGLRGNSGRSLGYIFFETEIWSPWKLLWYDSIEWVFIQGIFGYGVHPRRVMVGWFSTIILFAFVYWAIDGMIGGLLGALNYLGGSFATAIAPGYIAVIINSTTYTSMYKGMAIFETIIGTFLWAGFIATFAKKYMK